MEPKQARDLWRRFEPVHSVTYFDSECTEAFNALGLKGFWMGYFAGRASPMGAVGPDPVTAMFFSFRPSKVARALPDAWGYATPEAVLRTRGEAAAMALRRRIPEIESEAGPLVEVLGPLVEQGDIGGRVLFSANRALEIPEDPVGALWQLTTSLREHRGDGHTASLCAHGLGPCEALVLFAASEGIPGELYMNVRGWTEDEWRAAGDSLRVAGLLDDAGITVAGRALRDSVEADTDAQAAQLFSSATEADVVTVADGLGRLARRLIDQGLLPQPNPVGLRAPGPG